MWVEDGTICPLYTFSDAVNQPIDSQTTPEISHHCPRICVRSDKKLLAGLQLKRQMLLYLGGVKRTCQNFQNIDIAVFDIQGVVELLPFKSEHRTSLLQRLEESRVTRRQIQPKRQILENTLVHPTEVVRLKEQSTNGHDANNQPVVIAKENDKQDQLELEIEQYESSQEVTVDTSPHISIETSAEAEEPQTESQKGKLLCNIILPFKINICIFPCCRSEQIFWRIFHRHPNEGNSCGSFCAHLCSIASR